MKKGMRLTQVVLMACIVFVSVASCIEGDEEIASAGTLTDADGNNYNTIKIGDQTWTVENLKTTKYNDGTAIANVTGETQWGNTKNGAYSSYDNLESNANKYGLFYNWYAVNSGKIAPKGWHVATEEEWVTMELYLIDRGYNYDNSEDDNKIIKSLCTKTNWESSSIEGTPGESPETNNRTGFSAFPGGYRDESGTFHELGRSTYWWTSSLYPAGSPIQVFTGHDHTNLTYGYSEIDREYAKGNGFYVRLVKD